MKHATIVTVVVYMLVSVGLILLPLFGLMLIMSFMSSALGLF